MARVGQERALREAVKAEHPLVIAHPVTGQPALFVNPTIAREVVGCLPEESAHVLRFLHEHIRSLDFSCRVRWEKGTVVVWDQVSDFRLLLYAVGTVLNVDIKGNNLRPFCLCFVVDRAD